jgi:8-amino-7-oxononanoate synthase
VAVLDFTSSSYLGLRHPSWTLKPWSRLTTGAPAALAEPCSARAVAAGLARLAGAERAVLATSTLHVFFDLFVTLGAADLSCYVDAGAYPIAVWGAERAAGQGALVRRFPHRDVAALGQMLRDRATAGRRPVVVADGLCPGCGLLAPVHDYLSVLRRYGGLLVLDDTQAMGLLGAAPGTFPPYGRGGGGTLRMTGLAPPDVLTVSSLAKAFGVPVAFLAGPAALVDGYEQLSETRVHCSPPSLAHISAAEHALRVNATLGDSQRERLADLLSRLQRGVRGLGCRVGPAAFPVQALGPIDGVPPADLNRRLLELQVRGVLYQPVCRPAVTCGFVVTAGHTPRGIDYLVAALGRAIADLAPRAPSRWLPARC